MNKQELTKRIKLLELALDELPKIACDSDRLIELMDENKEVANILLKEYFKETFEEYKERINYINKQTTYEQTRKTKQDIWSSEW